ncbi:hypothetical protein GYA49_04505 [Candidatus Beckwithbacteria bacterium]|nr:hypothetical protein [Candidatus Beckwithbacteria bacterium]
MEDKYILTTKNYEDYRNYLLVHSFFFDILMRKLRKDLGLPSNGIADLEKMIKWDANRKAKIRKKITPTSKRKKSGVQMVKEVFAIEDEVRRKAYTPIWETIEKFADYDFNFSLLHAYVLGNTGMSFSESSRILMVSSPDDPIRETGVYIKYSPELSEKDIIALTKQARESYESLFKYRHPSIRTHDENGEPFIKHPELKIRQRKVTQPTKQQLKIFEAVENCLKENYSSRSDSIKMQDVFTEVASKLKLNKNSVQRSYHSLLRNYNLPTSVDTKNIF